MEFVAILFSVAFSMTAGGAYSASNYCKGDIIDIYYPFDREITAYDSDCSYTKTPVNCKDCATLFVRRSKYDEFKKSYTMLNMKVPVPRRTDTGRVFKPLKDQ